jgi:hypothetical protein
MPKSMIWKPQKNYLKIEMAKNVKDSQYENWDDEFDRAKKRRVNKKSSDYKRKEKYKNNYFDDEY